MSFDVSALNDYTDEQSRELISRLYFENTSGQYFTPMPGIKSSKSIHLIAPSATPQSDSDCSFNASGTTTLTDRTLTVGKIKYEDTLCLADLETKYTQIMMRPGHDAGRQDTSNMVLDEVADAILAQIQEDIERQDWRGDTASGDGYLRHYDGLIKLIDAGSPVAGNTSSATSITTGSSGNADTLIRNIVRARPSALKRKANQVLFVGTDFFDSYIDTLQAKNLYHINVNNERMEYEYRIPSTNVTLVGVHGLDDTNRAFLGQRDNFFLGMDGMGDEDSFEMWYSKDDRNIKYHVGFKRGVQVAYTNEIVEFTLS